MLCLGGSQRAAPPRPPHTLPCVWPRVCAPRRSPRAVARRLRLPARKEFRVSQQLRSPRPGASEMLVVSGTGDQGNPCAPAAQLLDCRPWPLTADILLWSSLWHQHVLRGPRTGSFPAIAFGFRALRSASRPAVPKHSAERRRALLAPVTGGGATHRDAPREGAQWVAHYM